MAWLTCLSSGLFFFYQFFQLNLFDVLNQPLREAFQLDATQLSWMSSTYLCADIFFLFPAGMILDRFSTRRVILSSLLICILGTVGFALTTSFVWASCFHFLAGIGHAFCFLACVVLVSRWFPPRRQAFVIGCIVTMAFIGGMMAHTPLVYLAQHFGWRGSLLIDGGIGALILVWIAIFVQDGPSEDLKQKESMKKDDTPNMLQALKCRETWLAGLYTACLNLPIMVICALWGASYLQTVHQLEPIDASNVVSLIFMGSILGCPLVGWISDRTGRRKPMMLAGAMATLLVMLPLLIGVSLPAQILSVLFFLMGFFTSTQVISYPLIAESNRKENTGSAIGFASLIIMGTGGVGQVLFGWLMAYHAGIDTQRYVVSDFQFAMWMFPVAIIIALLAMIFIRETYSGSQVHSLSNEKGL